MEPMLITVTLIALGLATAMTLVTWRLWRQERRRSAARAAWLAARVGPPGFVDLPLRAGAPGVRAQLGRIAGPTGGNPRVATAQHSEPPAADRVERTPAWRATSFSADGPASAAAPGYRVTVAIGAVVVTGAVVLAFSRLVGAPAARQSAQAQPRGRPTPLALVSLDHATRGDVLTVTGVVENPLDGVAVDGATAVVSAFDPAGVLLASAGAPLERAHLPAGARSGFVVIVPGARGVGRYRVGFRAPDGSIVQHVDRREVRTTR